MPYITSVEQIGYDRGKVEGKVEGKIEDKVEGKVEGKVEERKSIALNMLKDNLPLETIARFTGLSIAQIQLLQN